MPSAANHFNEATLSHPAVAEPQAKTGGEPARPGQLARRPVGRLADPWRRETRELEEEHHALHPIFVTLFIETDADEALTEQRDRKRRAALIGATTASGGGQLFAAARAHRPAVPSDWSDLLPA
jgi:hypothetical protein